MSIGIQLRGAEAGPFVTGNPGDVLTWNPVTRLWAPAPGAGGAVSSVFGRSGAVVAAAGDYAASQVTNDSVVAGLRVDDALDALLTGIADAMAAISALTTTGVANSSGVAGATATAALNTLNAAVAAANAAIAALTSSNIANSSSVTGATVTLALNTLKAVQRHLWTWGTSAAPGVAATRFLQSGAHGSAVSTSPAVSRVPMACGGEVTAVTAFQSAAFATDSLVYTLLKNGVATALTVTIGVGGTAASATGSVTYVAGDIFTASVLQSGTEASSSMAPRFSASGLAA